MLKERLKAIRENDCKPINENDVNELFPELLNHIGDVDHDLRDSLVYSILGVWITNQTLSKEQIRRVKNICLHNLKINIGETEGDSVFLRSFSVLQIPTLLYAHLKNEIFDNQELMTMYEEVMTYFKTEIDLRGYISGKGWAHSAAHTADAIKYLMKLPIINVLEQEKVLYAIRDKIMVDYYIYVNDEDERMVSALMVLIERHELSFSTWEKWLDTFTDLPRQNVLPNDLNVALNTKNFLRSLYFRTEGKLQDKILEILGMLNKH